MTVSIDQARQHQFPFKVFDLCLFPGNIIFCAFIISHIYDAVSVYDDSLRPIAILIDCIDLSICISFHHPSSSFLVSMPYIRFLPAAASQEP